jgi:hypothetical protein
MSLVFNSIFILQFMNFHVIRRYITQLTEKASLNNRTVIYHTRMTFIRKVSA